jgi:hypothetical protein
MGRFWRGMSAPRQVRGFRKVKPASYGEHLAAMERELAVRLASGGEDHPSVKTQRETIRRFKEEHATGDGTSS